MTLPGGRPGVSLTTLDRVMQELRGQATDTDYLRPKTLTYTAGDLTQIDYDDGSGRKEFTYTAGDLTMVERYSASGQLLWTKDLTYTAGDLTGITVT